MGEYEQVRQKNGREVENFVYFFFPKVSLLDWFLPNWGIFGLV